MLSKGTRSKSYKLQADAADEIEAQLGMLLTCRKFLHEELLNDPLEAKSFGINMDNVADVFEKRLQLFETATRLIEESTTTESVNEMPLAALNVKKTDLWKSYIPMARLIIDKALARDTTAGAFVLGINAPSGSGKSTLVQILLFLLSLGSDHPLRIVQISSDDLYMGKAGRKAAGVETRFDPRSLDPSLFHIVGKLKRASENDVVEIPRFNKGLDDREPKGSEVQGPFDIVLFEGWRVGVRPGELYGGAFDYSEMNKELDFLLYIDAKAEYLWNWKLASAKRDHEREVGTWTSDEENKLRHTWDTWIQPFMDNFEKPLAEPGGGADLVITKDSAHSVLCVDLRTQLQTFYDQNIKGRRCSTIECQALLSDAFGHSDIVGQVLRSKSEKYKVAEDAEAVPFDVFAEAAEELIERPGMYSEKPAKKKRTISQAWAEVPSNPDVPNKISVSAPTVSASKAAAEKQKSSMCTIS
eukprot:gnl/TRDRNA2_/TRDRNA2_142758_c0_seq2.p1 gnl/TRDRNA2_/TRDRNA2_142758_c0~~gnl/TRDRNA2_/TRDRNA2_142758_c0_seq2.p1  ORF type:complete len:471 (+),score=77.09 gnl/TRDRNA2_/TRDRNA2_142758_c0_seq2:47-1459(+)